LNTKYLKNILDKVFIETENVGFEVTEASIWPKNKENICADITVLLKYKKYQSLIVEILDKNNFIVHNIGEVISIDNNLPIPKGHCYHGKLTGEYSFRIIRESHS
jgi:hypothetical protein